MPTDWLAAAVAENYDRTDGMFAPEAIAPAVDFLVDHAGGGRVLEFAIGTGRIALPLAERGVEVHGVDLSPAMIEKLRAKPGGVDVPVELGDFSTYRMPATFSLVYLVFNTIMNVTSQDAQVDTFRNAAAHLAPGGRFVVEVMVPDLQRLPPGETARPFELIPDHLGFDEYDVVNQGLISHHYRFAGDRATHLAMPFRYVWPAELDLMARLAGMIRVERWADWTRAPFTRDSRSHVSVWKKISAE
jgi:SAM-dependent methyltransferase